MLAGRLPSYERGKRGMRSAFLQQCTVHAQRVPFSMIVFQQTQMCCPPLSIPFSSLCFWMRSMLFQELNCNPRLIATGGFCANHTNQPLYANLIDPK